MYENERVRVRGGEQIINESFIKKRMWYVNGPNNNNINTDL